MPNKKSNRKLTYLLFVLILLFFSISLFLRSDNIDEKKWIGKYERDKFVLADSSDAKAKLKASSHWLISLQDKNIFQFTGKNKTITGTWAIEQKEGDDYLLKFKLDNDFFTGHLNGSVIYFDNPPKIFDGIFEHVIFVRTL